MTKETLITELEVQKAIQENRNTIQVDGEVIITPLAASSLKENNIEVISSSSTKASYFVIEIGCPDDPIDISGRNREFLLSLYTAMLQVRNFEKAMGVLFREKQLVGMLHLSIGQESVSVGASKALNPDDYLTLTHRGHGQMVARGSDMKKMAAELLGRATGYCKGKGGSMHLADFRQGILGANGIVGAGIVIATGAAMSAKIRKSNQIALSFFGDGAVNQGAFHEALNYASVKKLPVLYICENNQYAISTSSEMSMSSNSIAKRGAAYGIAAYRIDGQNVLLVYDTIKEAAERARNGKGPSIVECVTYRTRGHFEGESTDLRPIEERELWKKRDPILRLEKAILDNQLSKSEELKTLCEKVINQVAEAVRFAIKSPLPDPSEAIKDVYAEGIGA